ncbi:MAG: histidinol dehydrogenase [Candidatus Schekmanbacteria bacterium]|nr:MAG: histidinol dehydrogenase [Candidatus Schekmanbacteria bacterium]
MIEAGTTNAKRFLRRLKERKVDANPEIEKKVAEVVEEVKKKGDKALIKYTELFDGVTLDKKKRIKLSEKERKKISGEVSKDLFSIMKTAADRIKRFHMRELRSGWIYEEKEGILTGQKLIPVSTAGIYVPGGKAAYPSSVLMNAIPAKVAGVEKIIMCTPPSKDGINPAVIAAAEIAGVDEIFMVGGAQAIAAMAYGTESIPSVDVIVGPGNIFVATAKKQVFGIVGIDMIAGPTEVVIVADGTANPDFIAADMISQAEHDENASAVCISNSEKVAKGVLKFLKKRLANFERRKIAEKSLKKFGAVIKTKDIEEAMKIANTIAPEHLELMVANPFKIVAKVKNAGAVFLGAYTPEPVGDYLAGPNHVLPTGGSSRFSSHLSVDNFMKKTTLLHLKRKGFHYLSKNASQFAEIEGLIGHSLSVKARIKGRK